MGEFLNDVFGHSFDDRISASEAVRPIGGPGGDDGAAAFVGTKDGVALAAVLPFVVPLTIVWVPACGGGREDLEVLRGSITVGREREFVAPFDFAAVAFVADDGVLSSDGVVGFDPSPLEDPMVGAVGREGAGPIHVLAVAFVVAAPQEADSREGVLGAPDEGVAPERREQCVFFPGAVNRIRMVILFPTGEGAAVVFTADLPAAGVSAEEGHVATFADEGFEVVAHRSRPIFVVAHANDELATFEDVGVEFEITVGGVSERDPVVLGPGHEHLFPLTEKAGGRAVEGDAVSLVFAEAIVGVEAEAAPVIVGVVGVGGEFEQDGSGLERVWRFPEDEVARAFRLTRAEGDVVVAGIPIGGNGNLEGDGPSAAVGGGIFRSWVFGTGDRILFENGFGFGAEAGNFERKCRGGGGDVQG